MRNVCVVLSRFCSILNFLFFYANCNFRTCPNTEINNSKEPNGVTVVFHAILSEKFDRTEDTHIFIRGDVPIFHGWMKNSLEVRPVKWVNVLGRTYLEKYWQILVRCGIQSICVISLKIGPKRHLLYWNRFLKNVCYLTFKMLRIPIIFLVLFSLEWPFFNINS